MPHNPGLPVDVGPVQQRTVRVLMVGQAFGGVGVSSSVAVAALLAEEILGSPNLAGLAQTSQVLGSALAAFAIARVMAARGRRAGLVVGYGIGGIGAALCVVAGLAGSFALLLTGTLAIGSATAANNQARFAATDLARPDHRARALSLVVWATTLGSVLGPNLAGPGARLARWVGAPELTGAFVFAAVAAGLAAAWIALRLRPDPLLVARDLAGPQGESHSSHPSLRHVVAVVRVRPRAAAAMIAIALAHTIMVSVMVMTPLHMHDGGAGLEIIGFVISLHVLGMFAFAPLVGWLVDRIGRAAVLAAGSGILLAAVTLAGRGPVGASSGLTLGLFLLGLGWSCCMLAGSTLLVDAVPLAERPGVQGGSDLLMGLFGAGGGALAGVVVARWGYGALNAAAAVLALMVLAAAAIARHQPGRYQLQPGP